MKYVCKRILMLLVTMVIVSFLAFAAFDLISGSPAEIMLGTQATADDAEQTELYKQMERNLTEHAANVYIQDLADLVVLRNGLEGYQFYPIYVMDLSTVHYTA